MSSVDYATFVQSLPPQIRARYLAVHGVQSADSDLAHNLWRVAVENMPADEMLGRIDPNWTPPPPSGVTFDVVALSVVTGITHGALSVGDDEIYTWGDPSLVVDIASCSRSFVTLAWLTALTRGLVPLDSLDQPIRASFPHDPPAQDFEPDVTLAHLLSYTSGARPSGSDWTYSGGRDARGKHWPRQHALFRSIVGLEVWDFLNIHVLPVLGGLSAKAAGDGTCRVKGSARNLQKWARLLLDGGKWQGVQLATADLVTRSTSGGPLGDGKPYALEGWQTHLIRNGRAWEDPDEMVIPDVPDGFAARDGGDSPTGHGAIIAWPSWNATFAYRGDAFDRVVPQVCRAAR